MTMSSPLRPLAGNWLAATFLLLAAGVGALWYSAIAAYESAVLRERGRELQAIAELKIGYIEYWLNERRGDAILLSKRQIVAIALAGSGADKAARELAARALPDQIEAYRKAYVYESIVLLDRDGNPVFGTGAAGGQLLAVAAKTARTAVAEGRPVFSPVYSADSGKGRYPGMDMATPIIDSRQAGSPIVGALALHINLRERLDPFLQQWPASSDSGETILVEERDGALTWLSTLRHADAAGLHRAATEPALTAALAARGGRGVIEGADYRGVPVLAAIGQVPDMPWFVVAKLDRDDILAPVRREALWSGTLSLLLTLALGLALFAWQRRGQNDLALARQAAAGVALAASEARFRKLHEYGADISVLFDRDMVIRYASPYVDLAYGHPATGASVATGARMVHPDDAVRVEAARQAALASPGVPRPVRHRFAFDGGRWIVVDATFTNLFDDPDVGGLSYEARDITARLEAETLLHESEARYRFLFENSPLPMWIYDVDTLAFLEVNPAAIRQYGYGREEFLAMTLRDIRPPEEVAAIEAAAQSEQRPQGRIWTHRRKDGSRLKVAIWTQDALFSGHRARMVLAEDVTARVAAEQALAESEARLRAIFDSVQVGIAIADTDGRYRMVNRAQCEMLGYGEAELLLRSIADITHPDDVQANLDLRARLLEGEMGVVTMEKRYLRKDGSVFWGLLTASPVRAADGSAIGSVGVIQDITERREAETERLAHARRQRDTLVREVHHRIKNHLQGLTGLLRQHIAGQPALQPVLEKFVAQINAIAVVHGLQGKSGGGNGLHGLIAEIVAALRGLHGAPIRFDDEDALCFGERRRAPPHRCQWQVSEEEAVPLALILNELLTNAARHGDGGEIVMAIDCDPRGARLTLRNGGRLPEGVDLAARTGLGTGLALVRALMPSQGLALALRNRPDGGVDTELLLSAPLIERAPADQVASLR